MTALAAGLALATVAAAGVNAGYLVQHEALAEIPELSGCGHRSTLRSLLASRRWVTGALLGYSGLAAQIAALALAPAWAVQAVLAGGLAVALIGWTVREQGGPSWMRSLAAVALLAGGLVAVTQAMHGTAAPDATPLRALGVFTAVMLALGVAVPRLAPRSARPQAEAIAAGTLYGITTVALATSIALLPDSLTSAAAVLALGAACAIAGLSRFQRALQSTGPVTAVLLMSAATNVSAIFGSMLLSGLSTPAPIAVAGLVALAAAGAVATVRPASAQPPSSEAAGVTRPSRDVLTSKVVPSCPSA